MKKPIGRLALIFVMVLQVSACASVMSNVTGQLADDLASTILDSNDVQTVEQGVPAYLLMIDSFLRSSPDDESLLLAASSLNGAFSIFADEERAKLLTGKALDYANRAACVRQSHFCDLSGVEFQVYKAYVDALELKDVPTFYGLGVAWASWIQSNSDDFNAIAQLGKVRYLMEKIIDLDETFERGGAHLYMGGLETVLPAALGGRPEKGREHFERANEIAGGRYLMTNVVFAEQYAKLVFDKELHDRLLREVLEADPAQEGMTLTNTVAQLRARELLAESDDYF